jgi:hypothetical protein
MESGVARFWINKPVTGRTGSFGGLCMAKAQRKENHFHFDSDGVYAQYDTLGIGAIDLPKRIYFYWNYLSDFAGASCYIGGGGRKDCIF